MAQNWIKENDRFMNLFQKREDLSLYWKIHHVERSLLRMAKEGKDEIEDFLRANDVLTLPVAMDLLSRIWKYNIHLNPLTLRTADGNREPETEVWLGETDEEQFSDSTDSDHVEDSSSDSCVVVSPTRRASPLPCSRKTFASRKSTVAKTGLNKKRSSSVEKVSNLPSSSHQTIKHTGRNQNYHRSAVSPTREAESPYQRSYERKNRPGRLAISPSPEKMKKRRKSTKDRPEPKKRLTKSDKTNIIKHTLQRSSHKSGANHGEYKCSKCKQIYMDQRELQKHRVICQTYH